MQSGNTGNQAQTGNHAEWLCLQHRYDHMEQQALWLRVVAIVLWLYLLQTEASLLLQLGCIALFWLQEAVWKTQQSRTAVRLLSLEQAISQQQDISCQWHSQWQAQRGQAQGLVLDYLRHSLKPTVALTYTILLIGSLIRQFN